MPPRIRDGTPPDGCSYITGLYGGGKQRKGVVRTNPVEWACQAGMGVASPIKDDGRACTLHCASFDRLPAARSNGHWFQDPSTLPTDLLYYYYNSVVYTSVRTVQIFLISTFSMQGNFLSVKNSYVYMWFCFWPAVVTAPGQLCSSGDKGSIRLNATTPGYLASVVAEETRKGSHGCPWLLQARPGEKINITLIDFTREDTSSCTAYATIKGG